MHFHRYGNDEFGYRIWDNQNKKVIQSSDVIFNEKVMYKDATSSNSTTQSEPVFSESDDSERDVVQETSEESIVQSSTQ